MSFVAVAFAVVVSSFRAFAGVDDTPPRTHCSDVAPGHAYSPVLTHAPVIPELPVHPSGTGRLIPLVRSVA